MFYETTDKSTVEGSPSVSFGFSSQRANNAGSVSDLGRHHVLCASSTKQRWYPISYKANDSATGADVYRVN